MYDNQKKQWIKKSRKKKKINKLWNNTSVKMNSG